MRFTYLFLKNPVQLQMSDSTSFCFLSLVVEREEGNIAVILETSKFGDGCSGNRSECWKGDARYIRT